jgi:hypothetical protein
MGAIIDRYHNKNLNRAKSHALFGQRERRRSRAEHPKETGKAWTEEELLQDKWLHGAGLRAITASPTQGKPGDTGPAGRLTKGRKSKALTDRKLGVTIRKWEREAPRDLSEEVRDN